jgi:hypothetical protein
MLSTSVYQVKESGQLYELRIYGLQDLCHVVLCFLRMRASKMNGGMLLFEAIAP